jgi:beta-lactamase class A
MCRMPPDSYVRDGLIWQRRNVLVCGGVALLATSFGAQAAQAPSARIAALEKQLRGRIGVAALDTNSAATISWRGGERFAMCSTFKWFLAAAMLAGCERRRFALNQKLPFAAGDLRLPHSPVSATHIGEGGMRIAALCEAAVEISDNLAANTLFRAIGGPPALTAWLRHIGDFTTRLDRYEPALNENLPGDPRDTTTPEAMLATMRRLLLGAVLAPQSRSLLIGWMRNCKTGLERLRAGLPPAWIVADKTGTGTGSGPTSAVNDLAIAWPPHRAPILITSYVSGSPASEARQIAAHAEIARIMSAAFA